MSMPNIPDVDANVKITYDEAINLLLASIAFEELGLAHIINAEAEKIQYVVGTLKDSRCDKRASVKDLLDVNRSVERVLRNVIKKEMLLQFKLEDTLANADKPKKECC